MLQLDRDFKKSSLFWKGCEWIKSEKFQKKAAEEQKRKEKENPMKVKTMMMKMKLVFNIIFIAIIIVRCVC